MLIVFHDTKNINRSNRIAKKKNVNCVIILLGSGSRVISRVRIVNEKPARKVNSLLKLDICLI